MIEPMKAVVFDNGKVTEHTVREMAAKIDELVEEMNRKIEEKPEKKLEKESKLYSGRIMCIESEDEFFTVGRIYPCINGVLIDDTEDKDDPYTREIKSFDEINKETFAKFIEVAYEVKIDE